MCHITTYPFLDFNFFTHHLPIWSSDQLKN